MDGRADGHTWHWALDSKLVAVLIDNRMAAHLLQLLVAKVTMPESGKVLDRSSADTCLVQNQAKDPTDRFKFLKA
jgi:hypothetical protein